MSRRPSWSSLDPREAELRSLFGQLPSQDEIVQSVSESFASDLERILRSAHDRRVYGPAAPRRIQG